jgi:hypothetical protein
VKHKQEIYDPKHLKRLGRKIKRKRQLKRLPEMMQERDRLRDEILESISKYRRRLEIYNKRKHRRRDTSL